MKNPFEYPAPAIYYPITTFSAPTVADKLEMIRKMDASQLREVIAYPKSGLTAKHAAERRLRRMVKDGLVEED